MKQLSITAAIAAIVGAVVALVMSASGPLTQRAVGKRVAHATIHLTQVGGSCRIVTVPQTLEVYKRERVQWTIVDLCGVTAASDVRVAFANDPLDASCTKLGRQSIRCDINPDAAFDVYKYTVSATGADTEDPELDIVR